MLSSSIFVFSGCNGGSEPTVTIKPSQAILLLRQTLQFNVAGKQAPVANLMRFVNGVAGVAASIGTISYTAPSTASPTEVLVKASDSVSCELAKQMQYSR